MNGEGGGGFGVLENLRNAGWFGGLEYLDLLPGIEGLEGEEGEPKDLYVSGGVGLSEEESTPVEILEAESNRRWRRMSSSISR